MEGQGKVKHDGNHKKTKACLFQADDLMAELEACRCEGRNYSSEVFRLKAGYDETMEQLDVVKRENKVNFYRDPCCQIEIFRTSPTRSRICSTSLAMAAVPSTSWTNRGGGLRSRRRSCRVPLKRPKALLNKKRTRYVVFVNCILMGPAIGADGCPGACPGEAGD